MADWFRSLSVLGIAFAGVAALTFGLAALIVPGAAGSAQAPLAPTPGTSGQVPVPTAGGPITTIGGVLQVTGDRQGDFVLDREDTDQGYALAGADGHISFGGNPIEAERIGYDGLEFYLDPGDCELEPGERDDPTGVAGLTITCTDISDVRDGGVVSLTGTLGVSADVLGLRGDLPPTGGTIEIGDQAIEISGAYFLMGISSDFRPSGGFVFSEDGHTLMHFNYDPQTHALVFETIEIDGVQTQIQPGDCSMTYTSLGRLNPTTTTQEMTIECPAVRMASGETVRVGGTLIGDFVDPES
ncbi:MAG: hypothetical protein M3Y40_08610 [Chloroflexota bacterium]|nr:hypothetical protein [Chloroflexota bacterium]